MSEEDKKSEKKEEKSIDQPAGDAHTEPAEPEETGEGKGTQEQADVQEANTEADEPGEGVSPTETEAAESEDAVEPEADAEPIRDDIPILKSKEPLKKIFVVACERDEINADCLAVLKRHGIEALIVNHVDETRPLIEILHECSRIQFALIILSGDDFIYDRLTGKPGEAALGPKSNAVFYLGYLVAKLGNLRTMTIYREQRSFHLPTGSHNAAFVPYAKGGIWEEILRGKLQELKIL